MSGSKGFGDGSVWVTGTGGQFPNSIAFAALREDGSVVTWGHPVRGGDSSAVAGQLDAQGSPAVTQVFSTSDAFAALREDGSVVTWGFSSYGGDSRAVAGQLDAQGSPADRRRHSGQNACPEVGFRRYSRPLAFHLGNVALSWHTNQLRALNE